MKDLSMKNKFIKSQSFSKNKMYIHNSITGHLSLNRTINIIEKEISVKNLINTSVEKVNSVIKKHSNKALFPLSGRFTPGVITNQSNLVVIEEKVEHINKVKYTNIKKVINSKKFDSKTEYTVKKQFIKSKLLINKETNVIHDSNINVEKAKNFDFLKGFKEKMKTFLKDKKRKDSQKLILNSQIKANNTQLKKNSQNKLKSIIKNIPFKKNFFKSIDEMKSVKTN